MPEHEPFPLIELANDSCETENGELLRVLLVEDDPDFAKLVQHLLAQATSEKFDVEHVSRLHYAVEERARPAPEVLSEERTVSQERGIAARVFELAGQVSCVLVNPDGRHIDNTDVHLPYGGRALREVDLLP